MIPFVSFVAFVFQINAEFQRTTTVLLELEFMSALDRHTPKLLTLSPANNGTAAGTVIFKIRSSFVP